MSETLFSFDKCFKQFSTNVTKLILKSWQQFDLEEAQDLKVRRSETRSICNGNVESSKLKRKMKFEWKVNLRWDPISGGDKQFSKSQTILIWLSPASSKIITFLATLCLKTHWFVLIKRPSSRSFNRFLLNLFPNAPTWLAQIKWGIQNQSGYQFQSINNRNELPSKVTSIRFRRYISWWYEELINGSNMWKTWSMKSELCAIRGWNTRKTTQIELQIIALTTCKLCTMQIASSYKRNCECDNNFIELCVSLDASPFVRGVHCTTNSLFFSFLLIEQAATQTLSYANFECQRHFALHELWRMCGDSRTV